MREKDWCDTCKEPWASEKCNTCKYWYGKENNYVPMTNADRVRGMTDEELAKTMHDMTLISTEIRLSTEWWEQWLKAPVEEVQDGT